MTEILERRVGFSDELMLEHCDLLIKVLSATKTIKVGRGASAQSVQVLKYPEEKNRLDMIIKSREYYKQMMDSSETKFNFRDYQKTIIADGFNILSKHGFLYLAMEVRTGKTLTSLGIASKAGAKNVLFVTKKKAIGSIEADYEALAPSFNLCVINYESLHHVADDKPWDLLILDEAHSCGAFPKPNNRAQMIRSIISKHKPKVILLSGTPTPESYSQMYHQVYAIPGNPFSSFSNFYRFADTYVKVREKKINGYIVKDYSNGIEDIIQQMKPYTINYTQQEAGFMSEISEEILEVEMQPATYKLIATLKKDLVVNGKTEIILGDTPVKLMNKVHQLCSGTIKFESGASMVLDLSKAKFIREHFDGHKIGIFYKFKEELNAIQEVFGDLLTTELDEFNTTNKSIALQIQSGREGISLKLADYLVYYNIDFSATSYWQSRDRMTTKDRLKNKVYWIFSKKGIEKDIYKAVTKKKDYTVNHFKKTIDD
jgi:hypothetical protein